MDARSESRIGCTILTGAALALLGVPLTIMLYGGGAARFAITNGKDPGMLAIAIIGPLTIILGIAVAGWGIFLGMAKNRRMSTSTTVRSEAGVRIMARFASRKGHDDLLFNEMDILPDDPDLRFFVQIQLPNGQARELRCAYPVFASCGEGMVGDAEIQGDWLGRFVRRPVPTEHPR